MFAQTGQMERLANAVQNVVPISVILRQVNAITAYQIQIAPRLQMHAILSKALALQERASTSQKQLTVLVGAHVQEVLNATLEFAMLLAIAQVHLQENLDAM